MAKVVVLGAGPMGLAAAYQAAKDGHDVDLLEAAPEPGGMAAHFDFDGLSIERFYHFICKSDAPTFELLRDLGIADKMRWRNTTMGFYFHGLLQRWGDPIALLRLRGVGLLSKLRYGLFAFVSTRRHRWDALETEDAKTWIRRWCGEQGYRTFWHELLTYKFYEYADNISAAWIWTRIHRIGLSRKSMMQEELGYLEGGSQTLVDALVKEITRAGGKLHLRSGASRVLVANGAVTGVETPQGVVAADYVISTVPVQLVPALVPDLPESWKAQYEAIVNIGICCVLFKLRRSVSPHFWVNIHDTEHEIPGVIEFSNLRPMNEVIIYVPYYMPVVNHKFSWTDEQLQQDAFACLQKLNPQLQSDDVIAAYTGRLRHAQPICEPGFAAKIPPIQTPIVGLQVADTCFYYPEDRGIAESVRLGRAIARSVGILGAATS